jgi:spore maturation protein CgeB
MTAPVEGRSVLLVAPFDHVLNAHSKLRSRALERLGCTVREFNVLGQPRWFSRIGRRDRIARLVKTLSKTSFDMVLVVGPRAFTAEEVARLRHHGGTRWVWWSPDSAPGVALDETVQAYDRVFLGGTDIVAQLRQTGADTVEYLPPGCDPSFHRPMRSRDQFRANVVFAGRASPRREELLSEVIGCGLAVWGRGWRKTSLKAYCRGEKLTDQDYVRAYSGASVALNIHRETPDALSAACNPRVFELASLGATQVVDHREDLELHFVPGRHLAVFEHPAGLKDLVQSLLLDPPAAAALGQSAREIAIAEHTYMHRMVQLLRAVDGA